VINRIKPPLLRLELNFWARFVNVMSSTKVGSDAKR
jgi:hypothetical protein